MSRPRSASGADGPAAISLPCVATQMSPSQSETLSVSKRVAAVEQVSVQISWTDVAWRSSAVNASSAFASSASRR